MGNTVGTIMLGNTHPMYNTFSEALALLPIKEGMSVPTARITKKLSKGLVKYNKDTNIMTVNPAIFDTDHDLDVLTKAYEDAFVVKTRGRIKGTKNKIVKVRNVESNLFKLVSHRAVRQFTRLLTAQCGDVKIVGDSFTCGGVTLKYDPENVMHKTLRTTLDNIKRYGVEVEAEAPVAELITNTITVKELRKMTVPALTKIAAKYQIKGRGEMTKKDLIETLADHAHL